MALDISRFSSIIALLKVPFFAPALLAILLAMLSEAMAFSYLALLAVDKVGMAPLELGAFFSLSALSGIAATLALGHLHDRAPVRWPLLASLAAKAAGFGLCVLMTEVWMLLLNAAILLGISSASFALLFAMARGYLQDSSRATISQGMALLRMVNSISWTVGPAIGAALIARWSFEGIYFGAAVLAVSALLIVMVNRVKVPLAAAKREPIATSVFLSTAPVIVALTTFHAAMFAGSSAVSIVVGQEFKAPAHVGALFSLCAVLEVALMSLFVLKPAERASRGILLLGFLIFSVSFFLPIAWPGLPSLYVAQGFRAAGIAIISIVGMALLQELLPGRTGIAAALFGGTASTGLLFSGLGVGSLAHFYGYWSVFGACGALCLAGAAACAMAQRSRLAGTC